MVNLHGLLLENIDQIPFQIEHVRIMNVNGLEVAGLSRSGGVLKYPYEKWYEEARHPSLAQAMWSLAEYGVQEVHHSIYSASVICSSNGIIAHFMLHEDFYIYIIWDKNITPPQLYQKWDALEQAIDSLRQAMKGKL